MKNDFCYVISNEHLSYDQYMYEYEGSKKEPECHPRENIDVLCVKTNLVDAVKFVNDYEDFAFSDECTFIEGCVDKGVGFRWDCIRVLMDNGMTDDQIKEFANVNNKELDIAKKAIEQKYDYDNKYVYDAMVRYVYERWITGSECETDIPIEEINERYGDYYFNRLQIQIIGLD